MNKFHFTTSMEFFVVPIKVKDINKPWEEFINNQTGTGKTTEYIIIEPRVGIDPTLCEEDNFVDRDIPVNYCTYTFDEIDESEYWPETTNRLGSINKFNIACLKNSAKFKHIPFATFIAMTEIFNSYKTQVEMGREFSCDKYVIINTRSVYNEKIAQEYSYMAREIVAAYNSVIDDDFYPFIYIAYSDDSVYDIINDINKGKNKKKKKHKKDKKKGNK